MRLDSARKTLESKESQIADLRRQLHAQHNESEEIRQSILFKTATSLAKKLDRSFPQNSRRGEILRLSKASLDIIQNDGYVALLRAIREKRRGRAGSDAKDTVIVSEKTKQHLDEASAADSAGTQIDELERDKAELGRQVDELERDKAELGRQVDELERDKAELGRHILAEKVRRYSETVKLDDPKLSSRIICNEYPVEPDEDLRDHMQIGSAKILTLPRNPKVSIIIPTLNQTDYLRKNLKSIESKTTYKNYEIIIVTNNKDEDSEMRRYLDGVRYKVLIYDDKYSFAKINNYASKSARGEYLLFLNDDMEVASPNWLEAMLKLALDKKTGAVGGKLLSTDGTLQEAGCIVWGNGSVWNYGRGDDPDKAEYNFVREVDYCSGACLMIRREIFEESGGFDAGYEIAYWEDSDLCQAIRQRGYSILYQPMACLVHHEGRTQGTDTSTGIKSFQVTNKERYMKKWGGVIQGRHPDSPKNVFFERNRKAGLNILYIDQCVPEYDRDAGSLTAYYVVSILASMNHNVTFWPDNLVRTEPHTAELQQKGIEAVYGNRDFEEFLKGRRETFHVCFTSRPHITARYFDHLKRYAPGCKIIYDTTDLHFVREYRMAVLSKDQSKIAAASRNSEGELSLIGMSDVVIVKSLKEARFLLNEDPDLSVAVIPPMQIPLENPVPFEKRRDFLFLGGFAHLPNVDALEFLINRIFPKIREHLPDARLYVTGSNASKKVRDLCTGAESVAFLGYIQDIEEYLDRCRIMLVPLTYGAGVKGKITGSFARGLPVVTTSVGAEGISPDDGKILLIEDDPAGFADRAISAYTDESLWNTLSKNSLAFANTHYSPELGRDTLTQILAKEANGALPPPSTFTKKDIICFPIIDWGFRYQRSQHIMSKFAEAGHRVFYLTVDLECLKTPYEITEIKKDVYELKLRSPTPFNIYREEFNAELVDGVMESFLHAKDVLNIDGIAFVQYPTWFMLVRQLQKKHGMGVVFDILDEFMGFDNVPKARIREEKDLIECSDMVTASSSYLMKKTERSSTVIVPNACEYEHFAQSDTRLLSDHTKPIIGYFGAIESWLDVSLIEYAATRRPNWTFVLIGYAVADVTRLQKLHNVSFLGERPYSDLPSYLADFDVCLIPFVDSDFIEAVNPVKIYEYFAAGKPVVSTYLPELAPVSDLCYLSRNPKEFLANIERALAEDDDELAERRKRFARENTWDDRFQKLYGEMAKIDALDLHSHT